MPTVLLASLESLCPDWEEHLFGWQCATKRWYRGTVGFLFRLGMLVGAVVLLCAFILFFAKGLWEVYLATPMGKEFTTLSRHTTATVSAVLALDLFDLAITLTVTSLKHLLVIGAVAKLLVVKRYFYDGRGMGVRLLWYAGGVIMAAQGIAEEYGLESTMAQLLCLVPIASLLGTSFSFAAQVVPECNLLRLGKALAQFRAKARQRKNLCR